MAEAGTLVNRTGTTYVNAYDGVAASYPTDSNGNQGLTAGMKTYYETMMLENARDNMVLTNLGKNEPLPMHKGKIVEWRKWNTLPDADVLVEGVIPTGKKFGQTLINVTVASAGLYVPISDELDTFHVDPVVLGATEEVGASIARSYEKIVRAALQLSGNVLFADALKISDGSYDYVSTPAARTALSATTAAMCSVSPDMIAQAVTVLQKANAPYFDGAEYLGIMHPSTWYELRRHPEWIDVHKYESSREIFNGEVGELHGVRFLKTTMAPVIKGTPMSAANHTLTVKTAIANASSTEIEVNEALTTADYAALKGKKFRIGATEYELHAATVGTEAAAGSAKIALKEAKTITVAKDAIIVFSDNALDGASVYQTFILGKDAFAVIKPDGASIETIIHDRKSGIGGPLNQFGTVGGRFTTAAKILYPERIVVIESTSKYSFTDVSN